MSARAAGRTGGICVTVRTRPSTQGGESNQWECLGSASRLHVLNFDERRASKLTHLQFAALQGELQFSEVLGCNASQATLYRASALGIGERLLKGASGCWLALGPPQSGKTYATVGELGEFSRMGVTARMASDVLDKLRSPCLATSDLMLTMSCFLLGDEYEDRTNVRDLLSSPPLYRPLVLPSTTTASPIHAHGPVIEARKHEFSCTRVISCFYAIFYLMTFSPLAI